MRKIEKVVWQETAYVAAWTLILSVLTQAVFLMLGKWDITVLLGNLYSGVAVIFNFFMIGLTVQKAVNKEEKDAKQLMKLSGTLRMLFLTVVTILGVVLDCFNMCTVIIPLFFPRFAVMFRAYFKFGADVSAANVAAQIDDPTCEATGSDVSPMDSPIAEGEEDDRADGE